MEVISGMNDRLIAMLEALLARGSSDGVTEGERILSEVKGSNRSWHTDSEVVGYRDSEATSTSVMSVAGTVIKLPALPVYDHSACGKAPGAFKTV